MRWACFATPSSIIYYITNGTIPTTASTTGPVIISTSEIVIAIAAAPGCSDNNPGAKEYTIP